MCLLYVLVNGNPKCLKHRAELFGACLPNQKCHEFLTSLIQEYESNELFDLVLCEGLLAGREKPEHCLRYVAKFTKSGCLPDHYPRLLRISLTDRKFTLPSSC